MTGKGQFLDKYIGGVKVGRLLHLLLVFCYGVTISMQPFSYTRIQSQDRLNQIRNVQQIHDSHWIKHIKKDK